MELQEQYISGNAGLQIVGANSRLGYVLLPAGPVRRGAARVRARDGVRRLQRPRAASERTQIEIEHEDRRGAIIGTGTPTEAARHFDRALKTFEARVARGADDPFTRYYIAACYALRGERDRALDSLERVAASYPALTAARALRDPDLDSLRGRAQRFQGAASINVSRMYDVVIVGAGPAGLSAALILGRCRRRVLVCDTGRPRNAASHAMHGYLTRDGVPPLEFLRQSRARSYARYDTVAVRDVDVAPRHVRTARFVVTLDGGERCASRKLLIATGVRRQRARQSTGFRELYGRSVFHCPYCDGWEVRDQPIAIYGRGERGSGCRSSSPPGPRSRAVHRWSVPRSTTTQRERLAAQRHRDPRGTRRASRGARRHARAHRLRAGSRLARRALFFTTGQ